MRRLLVRGAILGVLLYAGGVLGFPYYQHLMMRRAVEEAADLGVARLEELRRAPWSQVLVLGEVRAAVTSLLQARANRVWLDLPAREVQVSLEPDLLLVRTNWEAEAGLAGYIQRFRFGVEGRRVLVR